MTDPADIPGTAALAICESLLLALNDRGILPAHEIVGVLKDAAAAHEQAAHGEDAAFHTAVATAINAMLPDARAPRPSR